MTENPSILSHVSIGTNEFDRAIAFYDAVLATLGCQRMETVPGQVAAYGKVYPEFWIHAPVNRQSATVGNGSHIGFFANSPAQVDAFYAAAIAAGGTDDGAPGHRPHYGPAYYGGFVRDPDGHKIEATFWDTDAPDEAI